MISSSESMEAPELPTLALTVLPQVPGRQRRPSKPDIVTHVAFKPEYRLGLASRELHEHDIYG